MPNWNAGVAVSSSGYAAPSQGVFWIQTTHTRGYFTGTIAGQTVIQGGDFNSYHEEDTFIMPVSQGDTITWTGKNATIYFFPMKGV